MIFKHVKVRNDNDRVVEKTPEVITKEFVEKRPKIKKKAVKK